MKKLLPILLLLLGIGAGVGAGIALKPQAGAHDSAEAPACPSPETPTTEVDIAKDDVDYVKLDNQFVVPVVREGRVGALVVMTLTIEVQAKHENDIYNYEPKLRDAFLQTMFDESNLGRFDGPFTSGPNMKVLRKALLETGHHVLGPVIRDVLITDITRQDVS